MRKLKDLRNNYKKILLVSFFFLMLFLLLISCQPKPYKIGILCGAKPLQDTATGFMEKMASLGYTSGKNIIYDLQIASAALSPDAIARKFVDDKVDLIFAFPAGATMAAREVVKNTKIPFVFSITVVEGTNLINSVQEPGNNLTGVRAPILENTTKRLEVLKELLPDIKKVYIAYDPDYPNNKPVLEKIRPVAENLGITFIETHVKTGAEIKADLEARAAAGPLEFDAILCLSEGANTEAIADIIAFGKQHKIVVSGNSKKSVEDGALYSYATATSAFGELVAPLVDKIIKGTPAGTIPVVSPIEELLINVSTARQIELTIPDKILASAEEVVK